jgi:carboxyl-terminal processing protease
MRRHPFVSLAGVVVVACAIAGGLWGRSALATEDRLSAQYHVFTTALAAVENGYIEKLPSDRLVYNSVGGMLQTLDPHSAFLDPKYYAQLRERQEGHYYGLGITIASVDGEITVVNDVFEGSPAYRRGIRRGDVIAKIEGQVTRGWTSDDAVKKLRGPKGTSVHISVRRTGHEDLIEMDVVRDNVVIPSVTGAFMIGGDTGVVRLQEFAENTDRDLGRALEDLKAKGMKRLVLDLRNNPGGPLDQAIRVANRFLPQGSLIVSTRGRIANSDQDYRATEPGAYTQMPVIVLVNRSSASASEIVSGALQDHDRALVVGETTFGKALVQSVYHISEGAGLALTTARYHTPSGRLIQRPWDGTFDEYMNTPRDDVPERPHAANQVFYTDARRTVFGGGGIEPDKHLAGPLEGFTPSRFGRTLAARQLFAGFAETFSAAGDTRVAPQKHVVGPDFVIDDARIRDFRDYCAGQRPPMKIDEAAFARDVDYIKAMIHFQVDVALFGVSEARRVLFGRDPQAQFALTQFPEAEKLAVLSRGKGIRAGGK